LITQLQPMNLRLMMILE